MLTLPGNRPEFLSSQILTSVILLTVHSFTIHPVGQSSSEQFLKMCNKEMTYRIGSWESFRMLLRFPFSSRINPLNAELNPICHLLILLGDLMFMGPCIVSIFQYISNKMQRHTVYLYLETALHVSGGTSTHHQERIQLYLQHLVFVTPLLLSAAIVEELEQV